MTGRVEDRQPQLADLDGCALLQLVVDGERLEVVIEWIDPSLFGYIDAHRFLVSTAKAVGDDSRDMDRRRVEQLAEPRGAPRVIAMTVGEDQMADASRVESILLDVGDDRLGPHPGADVDQGKLVPTVQQVDVAVEGVREVETVAARADEIDPL